MSQHICTLSGKSNELNHVTNDTKQSSSYEAGKQQLDIFSAFYGTQRFITVYAKAHHWSLIWIQTFTSYLFKIHF
jgi:hypothetical protein